MKKSLIWNNEPVNNYSANTNKHDLSYKNASTNVSANIYRNQGKAEKSFNDLKNFKTF